jgi:hypothetical protein
LELPAGRERGKERERERERESGENEKEGARIERGKQGRFFLLRSYEVWCSFCVGQREEMGIWVLFVWS